MYCSTAVALKLLKASISTSAQIMWRDPVSPNLKRTQQQKPTSGILCVFVCAGGSMIPMASIRCMAVGYAIVVLTLSTISAARPVISKGDLLFLSGNTLLVSTQAPYRLTRRAICSCTYPFLMVHPSSSLYTLESCNRSKVT